MRPQAYCSLAPFFHRPPSCSSVRKAPGLCRSLLGVPRARVPLLLAHRWSLLVGFSSPPVGPSSQCGFRALLSARGSSCFACCLRIRPGPIASPHIRPVVFNFTDRFEGLPCPFRLLYSQLHGCEDLNGSAFFWSFAIFRHLVQECISTLGFLVFAFITHPCLTIGAHAVMVRVVMIQAHLHSLPLLRPSRLLVEPLLSFPATPHKSPCLAWCMRRGLRPDVNAARSRLRVTTSLFTPSNAQA